MQYEITNYLDNNKQDYYNTGMSENGATIITTTDDNSIDLSELIRYRYKHNMSYQQIADKIGCHKSSVMRKLTKYISMLPQADEVKAWEDNKSQLLSALEYKVYDKMCNEDTLKSASFNNLAYGFQNISTQNRLEKGLTTQNIDITQSVVRIDSLRAREDEIIKTINARVVQDVVPADNQGK